ncbi:hypothetical protein THAOC_19750, partial [Thalassiosira oceanica]
SNPSVKPHQYLGGMIRKVELQYGVGSWVFSSAQYVNEAVETVEDYLPTIDRRLSPRTATPLTKNYRPEIESHFPTRAICMRFTGSCLLGTPLGCGDGLDPTEVTLDKGDSE